MSARLEGAFVDVENCAGSRRPVLYKNDVLETLRRQVLKAGMKKYFSVAVNLQAAMERDL